MPAPEPPSHLPLAHGPAALTRAERRPREPWPGALLASLLVVAGALALHGDVRWQAATQVAGLAWAARLSLHPLRSARLYAAALVAMVVLADLAGPLLTGFPR